MLWRPGSGLSGSDSKAGRWRSICAEAAFDLTVYDVSPERVAELLAMGAKDARAPA